MIQQIAKSIAGAVLLVAASAHADEADCIAARYNAAGKYVSCEAKAVARGFDDTAFLRCRQKHAATWSRLGTKYPGTSCVGPRFVDNGDETITDNLTQLVWEKKTTVVGSGANASDRHDVDNGYSLTATGEDADGTAFTDFLNDLNSTGFAGQHDWRLPTRVELETIISTDAIPCGTGPCIIDPLFLPAQGFVYWSSSTYQDVPSDGWYVNFADGGTFIHSRIFENYVRAVRGGL